MTPADHLFLDANVLFSAAYEPASSLHRLWKLNAEIITSEYAVDEARRNLAIHRPDALPRLSVLLHAATVIANIVEALPPGHRAAGQGSSDPRIRDSGRCDPLADG